MRSAGGAQYTALTFFISSVEEFPSAHTVFSAKNLEEEEAAYHAYIVWALTITGLVLRIGVRKRHIARKF